MGRAIFTVDTYEATVKTVDLRASGQDFALWCFSDILNERGIRFQYQAFLSAPADRKNSLIYQRKTSGQFDRRVICVLNMSDVQIDRIYRLVSTEHPVRMRIDYEGQDLLGTDSFSNFREVSKAQVFTGREPAGEGEGRTLEFPE